MPDAPLTETSGRVRAFAKVLAVVTFFGVVAGSAVTSTRSGLADPHWPTFGGKLLPSPAEMAQDRGKFYEHGHRVVAGTALALTWIFAVLLCRGDRRRWVRAIGWTAAGIGVIPAILGGIIARPAPPQVAIIHVSLAMLFLSLNAALATLTGRRWREAPAELRPGKGLAAEDAVWLTWGAGACALSVYAQAILGAVPRHMHIGAVPHIVWAFGVFTLILLVAFRVLGRHGHLRSLVGPSVTLLVLVVIQFFLGFTTFVVRPGEAKAPGTGLYELVASLHNATGALLLAVSVVLALRAFRLRSLLASGSFATASLAEARS